MRQGCTGFWGTPEMGDPFQGSRPSPGPSKPVQFQLVHPSKAVRRDSVQSRELIHGLERGDEAKVLLHHIFTQCRWRLSLTILNE